MKELPRYNPDLSFVYEPWEGNPVSRRNQYINLDGPSERSYADVLRWQLSRKPMKALKRNDRRVLPVRKGSGFVKDRADGLTWLGHASFLITLSGRHFLTDPVLYDVSVIRRKTEFPCATADLRPVEYILLSHNHRDHCDRKSLEHVCALNPGAVILTGLRIGNLLRKWSLPNPVIEMGWYQQYVTEEGTRISYLPAKHWNRRGLTDLNDMLWGSFLLEAEGRKIYFGADSGLGTHFREIGQLFPGIDYALLGIGAYMPEWFMRPSHTSPADAIQAYEWLGASRLVPMHFGTFDLSDEPVYYPGDELARLVPQYPDLSVLQLEIGSKLYCS